MYNSQNGQKNTVTLHELLFRPHSDSDTESDIIYLSLLGQPVIILNSVQSAIDLLDKKGAIYSDRPPFVLLEAYLNPLNLILEILTYCVLFSQARV